MQAVAAGAVPGAAALRVLEKHAALIDIQCLREREEYAVLRVQGLTRWLILGAIAAVLLAAGIIVWSVVRHESLVVEPFRVPSALGQAGLGGEVMATQMMDQLALMQSRTLSTRPAESYNSDWSEDIDVAIPNTGATVGQLRRLLRGWFGRETRISGEVVRFNNEWTVTARVTGHNVVTAAGPELAPLVSQVAEGVYRQTQPYRYVIYLLGAGRRDEALSAARELSLQGPAHERAWGRVAYANALGGPGVGERERLSALRLAAEALPDVPMPVGNYAGSIEALGRWEEALALYRRHDRLVGDGRAISEEFRDQAVRSKGARVAILTGDMAGAARANEAASHVGTPSYAVHYLADAARAHYAAYDATAGDRSLVRMADLLGYNRDTRQIASLNITNLDEMQRLWLLARITLAIERARALDDRVRLARELPGQVDTLVSMIASFDAANARDLARSTWPIVAPALVRIGRDAQAEALLDPLERDCYPCLVALGEVAAAKGDHAAARRFYIEAVRRGPSLPFAYAAFGNMLAAAGDHAGADAALVRASRAGPRWADPWKARGDLALAAGDSAAAARLYAGAADRAPRWGALHLAWARALWAIGDFDGARAKLRDADKMDLSDADRLRLTRMIARAGEGAKSGRAVSRRAGGP
jgi:tetratricopeptide (TPR) repeat protein